MVTTNSTLLTLACPHCQQLARILASSQGQTYCCPRCAGHFVRGPWQALPVPASAGPAPPKRPPSGLGSLAPVGFCLLVLALILLLRLVTGTDSEGGTVWGPRVTLAKFYQVREGMSYQQVVQILGFDGTPLASTHLPGG